MRRVVKAPLRKKYIDRRERVFFISTQAIEASSKNALCYDDRASGRLNYFIHADHLNTPQLVLDKNNQQRWGWMTEPFGTTVANNNPQNLGTFTFNLRLPGQYFDQESGLHYNMARYYGPGEGRYAQSDPIGLDGGINTYSYVRGNPTRYADPTGFAPCVCGPFGCICAVPRPRPNDPDFFPPFGPPANDPFYGPITGGGDGGGGCDCEALKKVVDQMYITWVRSYLSPTMPLPVKFSIWASYRAQKAVYESRCGPYDHPRAPPEPPRDVLDDFYSR